MSDKTIRESLDEMLKLEREYTTLFVHNGMVSFKTEKALEQAKESFLKRIENPWISVKDELPEDDIPVLVVVNDEIDVLIIRWEEPTWEETYKRFQYWNNPYDDGQEFEWDTVTHWKPLPEPPK